MVPAGQTACSGSPQTRLKAQAGLSPAAPPSARAAPDSHPAHYGGHPRPPRAGEPHHNCRARQGGLLLPGGGVRRLCIRLAVGWQCCCWCLHRRRQALLLTHPSQHGANDRTSWWQPGGSGGEQERPRQPTRVAAAAAACKPSDRSPSARPRTFDIRKVRKQRLLQPRHLL